jgi:hypothetical protein
MGRRTNLSEYQQMTSQHDQTSRHGQQNQAGTSGQQGGQTSGGRGFAGMDRERQREIASQGGRAAHASGNAHQFTSEEARAAGSKRHANNASRNAAASATPPKGDSSLS